LSWGTSAEATRMPPKPKLTSPSLPISSVVSVCATRTFCTMSRTSGTKACFAAVASVARCSSVICEKSIRTGCGDALPMLAPLPPPYMAEITDGAGAAAAAASKAAESSTSSASSTANCAASCRASSSSTSSIEPPLRADGEDEGEREWEGVRRAYAGLERRGTAGVRTAAVSPMRTYISSSSTARSTLPSAIRSSSVACSCVTSPPNIASSISVFPSILAPRRLTPSQKRTNREICLLHKPISAVRALLFGVVIGSSPHLERRSGKECVSWR